jgi:hypothetical protein
MTGSDSSTRNRDKSDKEASGRFGLDEETRRIAERLLNTPPKHHEDMKIGKPTPKRTDESKNRPASKGRVHKGRTKT